MNIVMLCGFAWAPKATVSARAFPMAQELVRRGHQVTFLISPYDNLQESGKVYERDGVRVVNLEIRSRRPRDLLRVPWHFVRAVRRAAPDVVHVFKPKGLSGTAGFLLELGRRWPVVVDCDDWEGRGGWNDISGYGLGLRTYINFQEHIIPRWAQSVTVASRGLQERFRRVVRSDRLFYIPNGPKPSLRDQPDATPAEREVLKRVLGLGGKPLVFYAGHMNPADEPEQVLATFAQVMQKEPSAHLLLVGDGPRLPALRQMASDLSLKQVLFAGWLAYDDYVRALRAADVIFYPFPDSLIYRSKCSGKILEFMCLGKAIVTSAVGQNREYLEDGKSGILVPAGDAPAAAEAIVALFKRPERARELGVEARRRIWAEFSWQKLGGRLEQAYARAFSN